MVHNADHVKYVIIQQVELLIIPVMFQLTRSTTITICNLIPLITSGISYLSICNVNTLQLRMIIGGEKGDYTVDKDDKTTWEILDQEIDKLIKYSERQTDKMLNTIKIGMICITLLMVVWIVLYMVIKGFQM